MIEPKQALKMAQKMVTKSRAKAELQKGEGHLDAAKQESETVKGSMAKGIPCANRKAKEIVRGLVKKSAYEAGEAKDHHEVASKIMRGDRKALKE